MLKNPFVFGEAVGGQSFCNREREISELLRDIENGQNVLIYSPRRFGKTSLIHEVLQQVTQRGVVGIYIDLYPILSERDFVELYAKAIARSVKGKIEQYVETITSLFKTLRPVITVDPSGNPEMTVDVATGREEPSISDVAEAVNRYAERAKKQIVVVFDEFQQVGLLPTDRLEKTLRSIIQTHGRRIAYFFLGSKRHLITEMFANPHKPFYKSAKHLPLGKIKEEALITFLTQQFDITGKVIDENLARLIVQITESHPYYVQHLAHIVWENTEQHATQEVLDLSLAELLNREGVSYTNLWDTLTLNQRKLLIVLTRMKAGEKIFAKATLHRYTLGAPSSMQKTLRSLIERDLVDKTEEGYNIQDVFLKHWIRRRIGQKVLTVNHTLI
ncbi:MAG: ATP-binding protein [Candidatus Latescibacteria bacterium]|nr:ATP-binding protein [Candidatus Latescibacterota bacterium]